MRLRFFLFLVLLVSSFSLLAQSGDNRFDSDFTLELEAEYRYFFESGRFEGQEQHFPSAAIRPGYDLSWNNGYDQISFTGFFRLDRDEQRTHGDIRELYYQKAKNNWELSVGLKKVFWGVTETSHLVDIINQTDQVESFDGEQKLGQPMLQFTWSTDQIGIFDFFYLPYHRKRVFPGDEGRLRFPAIIETDDLGYESGQNEWSPSFGFRWNHYLGIADVGISQFYGNGREPLFSFDQEGNIRAFYPEIYQAGLDLQLTHAAFLWKLETIYRYAELQDFYALAAGLEYTFSNINRKGLDIGVLVEYLYDSRDELALTGQQNDVFFGSRLALNDAHDTAFLAGGSIDLETGSRLFSVEASRRIGERYKAEIEARIFEYIDDSELILSNFSDDHFVRVVLTRYF